VLYEVTLSWDDPDGESRLYFVEADGVKAALELACAQASHDDRSIEMLSGVGIELFSATLLR